MCLALMANYTNSIYHAIKDKHEWLKLQCMSLFNEGYIGEHTGQWSMLSLA